MTKLTHFHHFPYQIHLTNCYTQFFSLIFLVTWYDKFIMFFHAPFLSFWEAIILTNKTPHSSSLKKRLIPQLSFFLSGREQKSNTQAPLWLKKKTLSALSFFPLNRQDRKKNQTLQLNTSLGLSFLPSEQTSQKKATLHSLSLLWPFCWENRVIFHSKYN